LLDVKEARMTLTRFLPLKKEHHAWICLCSFFLRPSLVLCRPFAFISSVLMSTFKSVRA
jgi:hypothetical protein